jgi:hypothetical protein
MDDMNDLLHLKAVINNALIDLQADTRPDLKLPLSGIFLTPLVRFGDAYDVFNRGIGMSGSAYDSWINFQMQVLTDLGTLRVKLVDDFEKLLDSVIQGTPGGEIAKRHDDHKALSYLVLLATRVYGDAMRLEVPEAPEPEKKGGEK